MANLRWGQVFFHDILAGILRQEITGEISFTYNESYLQTKYPAIAYHLPKRLEPYLSFQALPPYFDNLVSEGWLETAQTKLLGERIASRFELLLTFGLDCIGAISIVDPEPTAVTDTLLDITDTKSMAAFVSRASLSGVQPKLAVIERNGKFYPSKAYERSTHIAKFSSATHADILENEFLTTKALHTLLPNEDVVSPFFQTIEGVKEPALLIARFDRQNQNRIHFEEFNQLLNKNSNEKYNGSYQDIATFIQEVPLCLPVENYRLFMRILAGLLLGNTDMHFKNFALFHTKEGLRLTPCYDQVAAALYDYDTVALKMGNANLRIGHVKANNILQLAKEFAVPYELVNIGVKQLQENMAAAKDIISAQKDIALNMKNQLISMVDKRWNGIFASIGQLLSKKQ